MATTPSSYARFIGRVGALAVALGLGAAIASSPGLAFAQDDDSPGISADGGASDSGTDAGTEKPDPQTAQNDDTADDATNAATNDAEGAGPDDEPGGSSDTGRRPTRLRTKASQVTISAQTNISRKDRSADKAATSDTDTAPDTVTDTDTEAGTDPAPSAAEPAVERRAAPPVAAAVATGVRTVVTTTLSALGVNVGGITNTAPIAPPQEPPTAWAALGFVRREIGVQAQTSPLATPEQLAAEKTATRTVQTLPVLLMKMVLRHQFLTEAKRLYPDGIDAENRAALNRAVDEYAMAAAFQQQLLDSMNPKVVTQVAPPHLWFGQAVGGSRILYDNPDTVYRFMGVNGASEYVITGRFHNLDENGRPADVTFSVLEGLSGKTSSILTADDIDVDENGYFTITVSREPANGRRNHLQLTAGSTIIAARDTLGDWNSEVPMSLSIERVGGPPNSLFAQIGGFAFLGQFVSDNPLLTTLVSLVPPLPHMPPLLRGVFTAVILVVRGASEQAKYMALATHDPDTGSRRPVNEIGQPSSNAEFLANQLQSNGHFQLADDEVLVLTIDPGDAGYFVVPIYNIWTITGDYVSEPASLNIEQAKRNADGTYTLVISPTDPGAANWVATGGLNQGAVAIRFQKLDPEGVRPRIVEQQVMTHDQLRDYLPADDFVTPEQRAAQLEARREGFDSRWT